MHIRPFCTKDAPKILSWCKDKHSFRLWSADRFRDYPVKPEELVRQFDGGNIFPYVAVVEGEIVGHLMFRYPTVDKTIVRLGFVIVDDAKRGLGYGKQMLRLSIEYAQNVLRAKRITLGVFCENRTALECYKSVGFRVTSENVYVIDGEEWKGIEMEWT